MAYARTEPHQSGLLPVGDDQHVYWEVRGRPDGKPAVMLHGGPGGGGRSPGVTFFDPKRYRIVTVDQRGCGRSIPHAGDAAVDLAANTTSHLIDDLELVRKHLGIDRWALWGGSWGVTLGLAYALAHPDRVTEFLGMSVTLTRHRDVHWLAHETGRFLPEEWAAFAAGVPEADRADLVAAYDRLINHMPDRSVQLRAAQAWCAWEDALLSLERVQPANGPVRAESPATMLCFARLVTHYFAHAGFLSDDALLDGVTRLGHIPAVLVHGRFDLTGPPDVAWELARRWPGAQLHLHRGGHLGDPSGPDVLTEAADRFADRH